MKITTRFLLALSTAFMTCATSSAQGNSPEYHPLVREGVKWRYVMVISNMPTANEYYPYTIEFRGDTIIDGIVNKKCYYIYDEETPSNHVPRMFVHEDLTERKVYVTGQNEEWFNLLTMPYYGNYGEFYALDDNALVYDFADMSNLSQAWCAILNAPFTSYKVEDVTLLDGTVSRMHMVDNMNIIEGVGCIGSERSELMHPIVLPSICFGCIPDPLPRFIQLEDSDGNVIYKNDVAGVDNIDADFVGRIDMRVNDDTFTVCIYGGVGVIELIDLSGRVVAVEGTDCEGRATIDTGTLPAGLYLVRVTTPAGITTRKVVF